MQQPTPRPHVQGHWTVARIRIFITALSDTGSVAHAAQAAGMSRSSAYRLRTRMAGKPFTIAWDKALAHYQAMLADPFAAAQRQLRPAADATSR